MTDMTAEKALEIAMRLGNQMANAIFNIAQIDDENYGSLKELPDAWFDLDKKKLRKAALSAPRVPEEIANVIGRWRSSEIASSDAMMELYLLTAAQSPAEPAPLRFADDRLLRRALQSIRLGDTSDADKCIEVILARSPDFAEPAQDELAKLRERVKVLEANYSELLYQVHEKIPGQSRHETALARLRAHNNQDNPPEAARLREGGA